MENVHVKMNAFHTLDIEVSRDVRIEKDEWDSVALATVRESCVPGRGAEVGAIVCGEGQSSSIHAGRGITNASIVIGQALRHSVYFRNI